MVQLTADSAVASGYGSAGERCMCPTLVVAVDGVADQPRPMLLERIAKLEVGLARTSDLAPQRPQVRQRDGHLHDRRWRRPAPPARG